jgi:hypothetical protein
MRRISLRGFVVVFAALVLVLALASPLLSDVWREGEGERVMLPTQIGTVTVFPDRPHAGERLVARASVTVGDKPPASATVTCRAGILGRRAHLIAQTYDDGRATCTWALPSWSSGESAELRLRVMTPDGEALRQTRVEIAGTRQLLAWRVVASGVKVPVLNDVVALSRNDVWIVGGGWDEERGEATPPTVFHWNGKRLQYRTVRGDDVGELRRVAATDADDVWVVDGDTGLMHWDGRQWKRVQPVSQSGAYLSDVAAIAANDVWVVGTRGSSGSASARPYLTHWDGRGWRVFDVRKMVGAPSELYAVDGNSASAVWAVGAKNVDQVNAGLRELILHWDGRQWKEVSLGQSLSERDAIDALSEDDIWTLAKDSTYETVDYITHSDGTREKKWMHDGPWDINAASPTSVFAVGWDDIVHWDGKRWRAQPSAFGRLYPRLEAVSATSADEAWAVGDHLIVRYSR